MSITLDKLSSFLDWQFSRLPVKDCIYSIHAYTYSLEIDEDKVEVNVAMKRILTKHPYNAKNLNWSAFKDTVEVKVTIAPSNRKIWEVVAEHFKNELMPGPPPQWDRVRIFDSIVINDEQI